ncbi:MAG: hypothetical protein AB8B56_04955 [Crocinitomicaceae bacterium]
MKSYLNIGIGSWIVLFALFLPFTFSFFPDLGIELTNGLSGISEWIAQSIFGVTIHASPTTSDSSVQFVQAVLLMVLALLLGLLFLKQQRFSQDQIKQFLHTASAYILSFFLLKYGVDKLFQFQFYSPEPNTLFTPLGMLSKDILFWSSMGTSSTYNTFMGLIEVIPAFLLLHHRTRMLGGFIALGVLINVLMINIGFDITVKLLSMYLVIVSLYVLSPFFQSLISFFFTTHQTDKPQIQLSLAPKMRAAIKVIVVLLIFTEVLFSYIHIGSFNGREMEKITHHGSYKLTEDNTSIFGHEDIERIHIHSKGYLILEDTEGNFFDYPMRIGPTGSIIIRSSQPMIEVIEKFPLIEFHILDSGTEKNIVCVKQNLDKLPASDDSFHWTVDGMVGDAKE